MSKKRSFENTINGFPFIAETDNIRIWIYEKENPHPFVFVFTTKPICVSKPSTFISKEKFNAMKKLAAGVLHKAQKRTR